MNVSYDYYRIFYYAAKYGSFTKAANVLLNNQPNITRAMKALESELECTLFVRSNRGTKLTPEGERLYQHISVAVQQIEAGEEEIKLNKTLKNGLVSIAVSETALHGLLLPVLSEFKEQYPGVKIKISNCSTPQAISDIRNGLADFSLITTPIDIAEDIKVKNIVNFDVKAVCGNSFESLKGKRVSLKELANYPLISLGPKTKTYELYHEWFNKLGLTFSPEIEVETSDQLMPFVKHNLGVALVPEMFIKNEKDTGAFFTVDIKEKMPERKICLVTKKDRNLSIASKKLIGLIEEMKF